MFKMVKYPLLITSVPIVKHSAHGETIKNKSNNVQPKRPNWRMNQTKTTENYSLRAPLPSLCATTIDSMTSPKLRIFSNNTVSGPMIGTLKQLTWSNSFFISETLSALKFDYCSECIIFEKGLNRKFVYIMNILAVEIDIFD